MNFRLQWAGICCLLLASQLVFGGAKRQQRKGVQASVPPPIETPQPPPTPEQLPATPPSVSMNNGMLSITAENSTLGDILNAVRTQTGANLDIPPAAASERVAAKLGPGNPQDVLQQLFAGSKFDYIIVGSPNNPDAIQNIILTDRSGSGPSASTPNTQSYQPPQPTYPPPPEVGEAPEAPDQEPEPASPEPQVTQPPITPPQGPQPYSNQPKSPEQLLRELQQMQQQQQQQQQRPPRNPPPQ